MSLLHPTPGEITDRISIVKLKIHAFRKSGMDFGALASELDELRNSLWNCEESKKIESLSGEIHEVNSLLWDCEDSIRSTEDVVEISVTAKKICRLNDERSRLVRSINEAYGIQPGEEKVYG